MAKKYVFALCALAAICMLAGCVRFNGGFPYGGNHGRIIREEGVREEFSYDAGEFTKVIFEGSMSKLRVYLSHGENSVSIYCDQAYYDSIEVSNRNDTLRVDSWNTLLGPVEVYISSPEYSKIECRGAAEFCGEETLTGEMLIIDVAGACSGDLDLDYDDVQITIAGAGELKLTGEAENLSIDCAGAASIKAEGLATQRCTVDIAGAGDAEVRCEQNLSVRISGVGSVQYWGNPELEKRNAGLGTVSRRGD